jgi:transposase InsO family protein
MHAENATWGAPRIHGELLRLDFEVSEATVSRSLARLGPRRPKQHSNQTWTTFLRDHAPEFSAMDFFTIYDIFFRRHYVFFLLDHECRHLAVTTQPNAAWVLQQLREAFPYDSGQGRRLICDSDPLFSRNVLHFITGVGIKIYQFRGQPWMNGHAERFVLSARQDIFNHVIVLTAKHLRRLTKAYVSYYHDDRTHIALGKTSPANQDVEKPGPGAELIAEPRLGGLHHRYRWRVKGAA